MPKPQTRRPPPFLQSLAWFVPGLVFVAIAAIGAQITAGDRHIRGVMIESNLVAGRQDLRLGTAPTYGQSITDGCIGWDETLHLLRDLAAFAARRQPVAA